MYFMIYDLIAFALFCVLQAMYINGLKDAFSEGMIFENAGKWIRRNIGEYWSKPVFSCVRCMSSVHGALTYWPAVLSVYGFQWWEIPVFIANVFILVYLTWYLYKRQ